MCAAWEVGTGDCEFLHIPGAGGRGTMDGRLMRWCASRFMAASKVLGEETAAGPAGQGEGQAQARNQ